MTKLKTTSEQIKTWSNTSRKIRSVMAKCEESSSVDANRLQHCLNQLKMAIKSSMSLPAMVERLKSHARQVGMKFNTGHSPREVFISSDVFYVEVMLENSGLVEDVKIFRQDDSESCPAMRDSLRQSNFKGFVDHLKGINRFYHLPCEIAMKRDAFKCLQSLEDDIKAVFEMSCLGTTNVLVLILNGLAGFVTPRIGGYPLRMTFFVSPYDLLNVENKTCTVLSMSDPLPEDMGISLSVNLEGSHTRKLQSSGTLYNNATHSEGKKGPLYNFAPLNNTNCINIPVCFMLKLNKPMPVSATLIKRLAVSQIHGISLTSAIPLNTLICRHALDPWLPMETRSYIENKFYVTLPGEQHCYFIGETNRETSKGVIVSSIPVACTSQAIAIVTALRQQAVYNTLVASCVRTDTCKDESDVMLFEVSTISQYRLTITFAHPAKIGMACVELDILEVANIKCIIHTPEGEEPLCTNEYATKVLRKCMSIPVTMRAIMKFATANIEKFRKPLSSSVVPDMSPPGSGHPQNPGKGANGGVSPKGGSTTLNYMSSGRMGSGTSRKNMPNSIIFDLSKSVATFFAHKNVNPPIQERSKSSDESKKSQNPMLAELLTSCTVSGSSSNKSHANPIPVTSEKVHPVSRQEQPTVPTLKRKIRSTSESKSPKQLGEIDDAVFLPQNNYKRQMSTPDMSSLSVSDTSAGLSGIDTSQAWPVQDTGIMRSPGPITEQAKRQKHLGSFDVQSPSHWSSSNIPIPWKEQGFISEADGLQNIQIKNTIGEPTMNTLPEQSKNFLDTHSLHESVFSVGNFLPVSNVNEDFPDFDPDDVNLLDEPVQFGKSEINKELNASYPLFGSGKPPLGINRSQSSDRIVKKELHENIFPSVSDKTQVKQPHVKSKGKPKNFKLDLEDSSSDTSPSPPQKKIKRKGKKREATTNNIPTLEHTKKRKKKPRIDQEKEPQTKGSFTLTASSDSLKIKFSRTGLEPKKQSPVEPKKVSQSPTNVKPAKIKLRIHPTTGETRNLSASQPQPKIDPDKRGNVFEVFGSKSPVKFPTNLEKRKVLPSELFSKSIEVRNLGKQPANLNKKIVTQKALSREVLHGQPITMKNNEKMQSMMKKVNVLKKGPTSANKAILTKKIVTQKTKFGSSKTVTPGVRPSAKNLSSPPGKMSVGSRADNGNKISGAASNPKAYAVGNVAKHVSQQKVSASRPPPLTISPSISSLNTSSPNTASPRQMTTPLSPTSGGGQKKNKSPSRGRTLSSIVQVLQMKAQTQSPEDELTEDVRTSEAIGPSSKSLEGDIKPNMLPSAAKPQKQKIASTMPIKSSTFTGNNKAPNAKPVPSTKVYTVTGRPPSTQSPKQGKLTPSPRSLSSPISSTKLSTPTSLKVQQKIQSTNKPFQVSKPLQKSPSSPMKPLVKVAGSPTTLPRKPNILSKAPKTAGSPKNVVAPNKVPSLQSSRPQQIRQNLPIEGSMKQASVRTSSNNSMVGVKSASSNSNTSVRNTVTANTSAVLKSESQITKKVNPISKTHDSKVMDLSKSSDKINEVTMKDTPVEKQISYSKAIHDSMPKTAIQQKAFGKVELKDGVSRGATSSPVTQFKIPSPAVVGVTTKTASLKPVAVKMTPESKSSTSETSKESLTTKDVVTAKDITEDIKDMSRNVKRRKEMSPSDGLESSPLFIDFPQESTNASSSENCQKTTEECQRANACSDTQTDPGSTSPRSMIVQSPLGIMAASPLGQVASPIMLPVKSPAALSVPSNQASPCPIDDDLMDEALISVISKEDN
ncbi:uncharacterized protein [Antedon mediterranea]|uniref:uncharacterized protein n=1 Tax=Antedon mediterranea TaxID=105859 RepID=UPI003AF43695